MYSLYPLKFTPVLKHRIWGGNRIKEKFGLYDASVEKCGEAWVLSAVKDSETIVENGHFAGNTLSEMCEVFMDDLMGEDAWKKFNEDFPLLLKIIDANDFLSVQVHPDDALAKKKHGLRFGKTEMWYVIHAEPGAQIVAGFNEAVDREKLSKHIEAGTLKNILKFHSMHTGDMIYLPAGMVHATGPGLLIAEIQQTSDITYRLYDWDRKDEHGQARELHIENALDAVNFELQPEIIRNFEPKINATTPMIETPYFRASFIKLHSAVEKNVELVDKCILYFALNGSFLMKYNNGESLVKAGECVLVPASADKMLLVPDIRAEIIEVIGM